MDLEFYKKHLEIAGVEFAHGLTESEFERIEQTYGFTFPPDLKEFLAFALPVSRGWPNWRNSPVADIEEFLIWPYKGICFDIEPNVFWLKEWGPKPDSLEDALALAKRAVEEAPTLIPIYGHRYIPDRPSLSGNPVFSVYQTDIIYYGSDLENYLKNEFHYYLRTPRYQLGFQIREIEFWSRLLNWDDDLDG